jgi:hypothetical protein
MKSNLLNQLREVDNHLSPENLCCDGEASLAWVRREGARLNKLRAKIIKQLGYEPSVQEIYPEFQLTTAER